MSNRTLWPYAIIAFFLVFIAGVVSFILFAVHHSTDLVTREYYEDELAYQGRIDATQRGDALADRVRIEQLPNARRIRITFPNPLQQPGQASFYRPSDASMDFLVELGATGSPSYEVDTSTLERGLWRVRLAWVAEGGAYFKEEVLVLESRGE